MVVELVLRPVRLKLKIVDVPLVLWGCVFHCPNAILVFHPSRVLVSCQVLEIFVIENFIPNETRIETLITVELLSVL